MATTLLAAELVARLAFAPPRYHNEPLALDAELGFRGIPGYRTRKPDAEGALYGFALNAEGFRGRELPEPGRKDDGSRRIVFLGDSFLVAQGLPEEALVTTRIGPALAALGVASEVYNLSAADYGTGQELLLLRRFGARLAPDLVVLAMYPRNDLVNDFEGLAGRTAVSPGDYVRPYVVPDEDGGELTVRPLHPFRHRLRHGSRLFAVLEQRLLAYGTRGAVAWLQPFPPPRSSEERLADDLAPYESLELLRRHPPGHLWEQAWQRSFALLRALRDECEALSARLVVVVIPDLHQVRRAARDVHLDLLTRELQGRALDDLLDWNLPERRLATFFADEGIAHVSLLRTLREAVRRGQDVYLPDLHLNARGHAVAANLLVGALRGTRDAATSLPTGPPVRLPRGEAAPAKIRLGGSEHWLYRDQSWLPWSPSADAPGEGALSLGRAFVAVPVPAGARELVVRGIAVARRYPLEVELEFVSGPTKSFRLDEPGPFVLRVAVPVARLPRSDGHVGLRFGAAGEAISAGVIVRDVGFE